MLKFFNWPVLSVLALVAAATTVLTVFIKAAEEVLEGDTHKIDWLMIMRLDQEDGQ